METRTPSCRERSHDVCSDDNNQREDLIEKMEGGFSDREREREGGREGVQQWLDEWKRPPACPITALSKTRERWRDGIERLSDWRRREWEDVHTEPLESVNASFTISERASVKCSGPQHGNRWRVSTDWIYDWSAAKITTCWIQIFTYVLEAAKKKRRSAPLKEKETLHGNSFFTCSFWWSISHDQSINFLSLSKVLHSVTSSNCSFCPTNTNCLIFINDEEKQEAGKIFSDRLSSDWLINQLL